MSESVEVDILANDRSTPAWKAAQQNCMAFLKELSQIDQKQRDNERSAAAFDKATKKWLEETRTPMERHNSKLAELKMLLDKGTMSQDLYARSVKKTNAEYAELNTKHRFIGTAATDVLSMVTGWISVGAAVGVASKLVQEFITSNKEAQRVSEDTAKKFEFQESDFRPKPV